MIRSRKPDMSDAEAFRIYDEALCLSEQMLGYETDAILADAFTRTAMGANLFGEMAQPLRSADDAARDPPPRWQAAVGAGAGGGGGGDAGRRSSTSRGPGGDGTALLTKLKLASKREVKLSGRVSNSQSVPQLPPASQGVPRNSVAFAL